MNLIIVINVERKSNPAEMRGTRARWGGGWHLLMDTSSDSPAPQSLFNCSMPCRPRGDACGSAAVSDARHRWTPRTLASQGKQKHNWCCSRLLGFPQKLVASPRPLLSLQVFLRANQSRPQGQKYSLPNLLGVSAFSQIEKRSKSRGHYFSGIHSCGHLASSNPV